MEEWDEGGTSLLSRVSGLVLRPRLKRSWLTTFDCIAVDGLAMLLTWARLISVSFAIARGRHGVLPTGVSLYCHFFLLDRTRRPQALQL